MCRGRIVPEDIEEEENRLKAKIDENLDEVFYWDQKTNNNDLKLSQDHFELLFEQTVMLYFLEGELEVSKNFTFPQALQQVKFKNKSLLFLLIYLSLHLLW